MNNKLIITLVGIVVVLAIAVVVISTQGKGNPQQTSKTTKQVPQSMMQNQAPEEGTMSMENMPCHKMGNGQWMGDCKFDEQGNPAQ